MDAADILAQQEPNQRFTCRLRCALCILTLLTGLMAADVGGASLSESEHDSSPLSPVSLGLKLGSAFAQHTGTEERDSEYTVDSWRVGFSGGLFVYWPVTDRFGIQQEFLYAQRGSRESIGVAILDVPTTLDVNYEMDYIELPILLRFTWLRAGSTGVYSLMGTALSLKIRARYTLEGVLDDGEQVVPISADSDMSEVEIFDYSFVYGLGCEFTVAETKLLAEYRFTIGWNQLMMPTYAYVPFGEEELLIENAPVPLKNQTHSLMLGVRF